MVAAQDAREDEEEDQNDHEDHENRLHMVLLPTLDVVLRVRVVYCGLVAGCKGKFHGNDLRQSLREEEQPELAVIQFSHAATDPEAMMVKLSDAPIAVPTMPAAIRLLLLARLAISLARQLHLFH